MSFISVFDVLGPNMIGPSSSHTAGAVAIALIAQKMISPPLKEVEFILYGSFAKTYKGHGTDRALLGGVMGFATDDTRIRDSFSPSASLLRNLPIPGSPPARGRFPIGLIYTFLRTLHQVQSPGLNCYIRSYQVIAAPSTERISPVT